MNHVVSPSPNALGPGFQMKPSPKHVTVSAFKVGTEVYTLPPSTATASSQTNPPRSRARASSSSWVSSSPGTAWATSPWPSTPTVRLERLLVGGLVHGPGHPGQPPHRVWHRRRGGLRRDRVHLQEQNDLARGGARHYGASLCTGATLSPGSTTRATSSEERKGGSAPLSLSFSQESKTRARGKKRGTKIAALHHARELAFYMLVI